VTDELDDLVRGVREDVRGLVSEVRRLRCENERLREANAKLREAANENWRDRFYWRLEQEKEDT